MAAFSANKEFGKMWYGGCVFVCPSPFPCRMVPKETSFLQCELGLLKAVTQNVPPCSGQGVGTDVIRLVSQMLSFDGKIWDFCLSQQWDTNELSITPNSLGTH